jgi:hypothetical protein
MSAGRGDRIVVDSGKVGTASREGEILEARETAAGTRYTVRWDDGRQTSFSPASGSARIVPGASNGKKASSKAPSKSATSRKPSAKKR